MTIGTAGAALHSNDPQEAQRSANRASDQTTYPVIDYSTAVSKKNQTINASDQHKRDVRGKKYDKSDFGVHPDDPGEDTVMTDVLDPKLPALPVSQSTAVVIGDVISAQAYLSNDRSGIYSEFTVTVLEVLKNSEGETFTVSSSVDVEREGGRIRFPSGRTHWYAVNHQNIPLIGHRYVFFLKRDTPDEAYHIITAYEFRNSKVIPLDELSQFRAHDGEEQEDFMKVLRGLMSN